MGGLVLGFEFMTIRGDEAAVGDATRDRNQRLAGIAMLVERAHEGEAIRESVAALERETRASDPQLRAFAALAASVEAHRRAVRSGDL